MLKNAKKDKIKLWVTRPRQDAPKQAELLRYNGYETMCYGLLDIEIFAKPVNTATCQAVIFTSANGVRAYAQNGGDITLPAFAVGDATKMQAQQYGFKNVISANGDVNDLSDVIKNNLNPNDGALFHCAGSVIAKDLGALLDSFGYVVKRVPLYSAVPCVRLTGTVQQQLKSGNIKGVLLMSPRTADIFVRLLRTYELDKYIQNMVVFSLSDAVASRLRDLGCEIVIAKTPTNDSLMQKINAYFEN